CSSDLDAVVQQPRERGDLLRGDVVGLVVAGEADAGADRVAAGGVRSDAADAVALVDTAGREDHEGVADAALKSGLADVVELAHFAALRLGARVGGQLGGHAVVEPLVQAADLAVVEAVGVPGAPGLAADDSGHDGCLSLGLRKGPAPGGGGALVGDVLFMGGGRAPVRSSAKVRAAAQALRACAAPCRPSPG